MERTIKMRKISLIMSGLTIILSLCGVILFLTSIPNLLQGDTDSKIYLFSLLPLIYSSFIFFSLIKNREYHKTHKIAIHLLVWPTIVTVAYSLFSVILGIAYSGDGLWAWAAIMVMAFGIMLSMVLSFIGFVLDFFLQNKKER